MSQADALSFPNWIHFFQAYNHKVIPLHGIRNGACTCKDGAECAHPGKHPRKAYKRSGDPGVWQDGDNLGIGTDRLVVIDIDHDDLDGVSGSLSLPDTFTVRTGRGWHLYFSPPEDQQLKSVSAIRPGVDIRAIGGLVVAPPSRTIQGSRYTHTAGARFVPLPAHFASTLPQRSVQPKTALPQGDKLTTTPEGSQQLVLEQLVRMMQAAKGERNATLFQCACRITELYVSGYVGADAYHALARTASTEGLGESEIVQAINSARQTIVS